MSTKDVHCGEITDKKKTHLFLGIFHLNIYGFQNIFSTNIYYIFIY